jgi:integrase/recombinase XerD
MLEAGLRVSEACSLAWRDVDLLAPVIMVRRGKGGKDRCVPITHALARAIAAERTVSPWVLARPRDPAAHITRATLGQACRRLGHRLGVRLWPHVFRHTYASNCLRAGLSIEDLRRLLGHSNLATTAIYLHVREDDLAARVRAALEPRPSQLALELIS